MKCTKIAIQAAIIDFFAKGCDPDKKHRSTTSKQHALFYIVVLPFTKFQLHRIKIVGGLPGKEHAKKTK